MLMALGLPQNQRTILGLCSLPVAVTDCRTKTERVFAGSSHRARDPSAAKFDSQVVEGPASDACAFCGPSDLLHETRMGIKATSAVTASVIATALVVTILPQFSARWTRDAKACGSTAVITCVITFSGSRHGQRVWRFPIPISRKRFTASYQESVGKVGHFGECSYLGDCRDGHNRTLTFHICGYFYKVGISGILTDFTVIDCSGGASRYGSSNTGLHCPSRRTFAAFIRNCLYCYEGRIF